MKIMIYAIFSTLLFSCIANDKPSNISDYKKIDLLLTKHKQKAFIDLYQKLVSQEERKYQIKKTDSLYDLTYGEINSEFCLDIDFYSEEHPSYSDENYDKLINKWLKTDYFIHTDNQNIKPTLTFKKAFAFYESEDLNKYIDSLRIVFIRKYKENKLESIKCIK